MAIIRPLSEVHVHCQLFSWKMKYSPRTFENVKMPFVLHFLIYIAIISGVTRALSQCGKLSWRGPTGHCTRPTSQHSEQTWETMVNPDVDSYAKTLNHRTACQGCFNCTQLQIHTSCPSTNQLLFWKFFLEILCENSVKHIKTFTIICGCHYRASSEYWEVNGINSWDCILLRHCEGKDSIETIRCTYQVKLNQH